METNLMLNQDLCYLSAAEVRRRLVEKSLSPVEPMQALITRSQLVKPDNNAFTETWLDAPQVVAREAVARYAAGTRRPLEGKALAARDAFRLAGTRRRSSSLVYRDRIDDQRVFDAAFACEPAFVPPPLRLDPRISHGESTC